MLLCKLVNEQRLFRSIYPHVNNLSHSFGISLRLQSLLFRSLDQTSPWSSLFPSPWQPLPEKCTLGSCKIGHVLHRLQNVGKSLHTQTLLGRDCYAKAAAKLIAFWPEQERVTGRSVLRQCFTFFIFILLIVQSSNWPNVEAAPLSCRRFIFP